MSHTTLARRVLMAWAIPSTATALRNITVPTTLIWTGVPRWAAPHTNIGNVTDEGLALKFVMM